MLRANKSAFFEKIFALYNRNLLKRKFNSFQVSNLKSLMNADKNLPLIIYANHSSWWDGLILFEIFRQSSFDSYVMMEEKQLKNYGFFRRLGAFSINRENSSEIIESLRYAVNLLNKGPNKTLLIFPQGGIFPNDTRPMIFFEGAAFIARKLKNCTLLPCSIRLEFLKEFKPKIFVKFGKPEFLETYDGKTKKEMSDLFSKKLEANQDLLKSDIIENNLDEYAKIF